ncbi:hypothetical protein [Kitasatospora sp. NPDC005748]|uniref:hypothetical protein n=1 Tax=Kitasatospora sp. NPDC005748 TaxID=3157063 RepID=UPI0033CA5B5B
MAVHSAPEIGSAGPSTITYRFGSLPDRTDTTRPEEGLPWRAPFSQEVGTPRAGRVRHPSPVRSEPEIGSAAP